MFTLFTRPWRQQQSNKVVIFRLLDIRSYFHVETGQFNDSKIKQKKFTTQYSSPSIVCSDEKIDNYYVKNSFIILNKKQKPPTVNRQQRAPELYAHCDRIQMYYVYIKIYSTFNETQSKQSQANFVTGASSITCFHSAFQIFCLQANYYFMQKDSDNISLSLLLPLSTCQGIILHQSAILLFHIN